MNSRDRECINTCSRHSIDNVEVIVRAVQGDSASQRAVRVA